MGGLPGQAACRCRRDSIQEGVKHEPRFNRTDTYPIQDSAQFDSHGHMQTFSIRSSLNTSLLAQKIKPQHWQINDTTTSHCKSLIGNVISEFLKNLCIIA
jgi:hypothetical protein